MKIAIGDGRTVEVDDGRYNTFQGFMRTQDGISIVGDSQEALAFIVSQLAYTEAQVFERLYTPMQYEQFIPITSEAGEWADSIRFEIYDYVGRGKRSSGKGDDINLVDVAYSDQTMPVENGNIGYDYNTEELRRTAYLRRPISERRLAAAMDGYRRHMNNVALFGENDLTGLFNNPNVPQGNAPTGGWGSATALLIIADMNNAIFQVWNATQFNDIPDTLLIAPSKYQLIATTPMSATFPQETILDYFKKHNLAMDNGKTITVAPAYGLDTGGIGGTARMISYVKDPTRLILHLPMALRFLAPQLRGLSVVVPGEYKYSGVTWRYPKSAFYSDGL